jgi:hypothetical protein
VSALGWVYKKIAVAKDSKVHAPPLRGRMRNRRDVRKGILTQEYYYCRSWFPD